MRDLRNLFLGLPRSSFQLQTDRRLQPVQRLERGDFVVKAVRAPEKKKQFTGSVAHPVNEGYVLVKESTGG